MKRMPWTVLAVTLLSIVAGCRSIPPVVTDWQQTYPQAVSWTLVNPLAAERVDERVLLDLETIRQRAADFNPQGFVAVLDGNEVPSQTVDTDADGQVDQVVVLVNVPPRARQRLWLYYHPNAILPRSYPRRTQAELSHKFGGHWDGHVYQGGHFENVQMLRCPPEHTDHSFFIRYEGPGWESDQVGYRFYLDWRNAIDIFGKKTHDLVLQDVGLDGFDSYHEMSDWGADIFKVGDSLGIGSIAMWVDGKAQRVSQTGGTVCRILASGPIHSQIQTLYLNWQVAGKSYHLISDLSIGAGTRLTTHHLGIEGDCDNLCTGIVKLGPELIRSRPTAGDWAYIATYGVQTLFDDRLGLAVFYPKSNLIELTEDDLNHVVVLKPDQGELTYHFLAAWEHEIDGIPDREAFLAYLDQTLDRLNQPLRLE